MRRLLYFAGFLLFILLWGVLTFLCYHKIIVFDSTTLGGAMISGLVLSVSILSVIRFMKRIYDEAYPLLADEPHGNASDEAKN